MGVSRLRGDSGALRGNQGDPSRRSRLAGAAQSILNPQLSGQQSGFLGGLQGLAGQNGIFGGVVQGGIDRARTQFLAGNRLSGLDFLQDDFFNFAPRGVSAADQSRGPEATTVLSEILGLNNAFRFGGQGGREFVEGLDPNDIGATLGTPQVSTGLTFQGFREARRNGQQFSFADIANPQQATERRFGFADRAVPGAQGLSAAGLLPTIGNTGIASVLGSRQANQAQEDLFSPLLF